MGLGARWPEIAQAYADVNLAFGDIVKVTPSSKVVGDLAIFLVSHDMSVQDLEKLGPDHKLTLPNSVVEMFSGSLGRAGRRLAAQVAGGDSAGQAAHQGRPGEQLRAGRSGARPRPRLGRQDRSSDIAGPT